MEIVPFDYMVLRGEAFCPFCGNVICPSDDVNRSLCTGTFLSRTWAIGKVFGRCPKTAHFHRKCPHCDGEWVEGTYDESLRGSRIILKHAIKCAEKAGLSEEDVVTEWRERIARMVMTT
jgi:hypothetical protein